MRINYKTLLVGTTFAGLATATLLAAGQTDAELMKQAKISKTQAEKDRAGESA